MSNTVTANLVLRGAGYAARQQMSVETLTQLVRWPSPKDPTRAADGPWIRKTLGTEGSSISVHTTRERWGQRMTPHEAGYTDENGHCLVTGKSIRPDSDVVNDRLRQFRDLVSANMDGGFNLGVMQGNLMTSVPFITDTDFMVLGALRGLHNSGISVEDLNRRGGVVVIKTCTPDTPHLSNEGGDFAERMGFDPSRVKIVVGHLGCAGVGTGLSEMMAWMEALDRPFGMVVGSNCSSGSGMDPMTLAGGLVHSHPVAAGACIFFSDGGGSLVFERYEGAPPAFAYENSYPIKLVSFPAGGSACQVTTDTWNDARYLMEAAEVGQLFVPMMGMNAKIIAEQLSSFSEGWPEIQAVLMHQANFRMVARAAELIGVDDRTPMTDDLANTVNASVPIVGTRAIEQGLLRPGGRFAIMTIGAGHGAQLAGGSFVYEPISS